MAGDPALGAELSSIERTVDELARRVGDLATQAKAARDEEAATELFAIERALTGALRRLGRLRRH